MFKNAKNTTHIMKGGDNFMNDKVRNILIGVLGIGCLIGSELFKDKQKKDEIRKIVKEELSNKKTDEES